MYDHVESDASIAAALPRPRAAPPTSMAARLGQVLAWTANTIAAAVLVIGIVFIVAAWDNMSRENTPALVLQCDHVTFNLRIDPSKPWTEYQQTPASMVVPCLRINALQAGLSAALLIIVTVIWVIGRAIRYVLTGPAPRTPWRIWHRPAGEGVSEDWSLQRRDGHRGPWITAAVYPTKQAAKAALRSIAR